MTTVSFGARAEDAAAELLSQKGYTILHRNYRAPYGEADIIARDGQMLVIVEVKARSSAQFGQPFEAVTSKKQEKLRKVALGYMKQHGGECPVRFDIVSIVARQGALSLEHIEHAF
ncbi:MAG: hypothetical protein FD164_701 [Nitrospirae bacterium]|nr:MAG: hypothetical protein FD164_701 [Nitrospirota bacterium]